MKDYAEIEKTVDSLIGTGSKYFNTLNFKRDALTFVPNKKGTATRYGVKGNWIIPNIPALSSASLRATKFNDEWLNCNGNNIETPFYKAVLNDDGSIASLVDKSRIGSGLTAISTNLRFIQTVRVIMMLGIFFLTIRINRLKLR